jgi:phasin
MPPLVRASRALPIERIIPMSDTTIMKPKPAKAAAPVIPLFEMPKFDIPSFEMPKFEVPAAFREFAEKGVAQTKDAYERFKAAAEENTETLETVYSAATQGSTEYGLKVIEIARFNTNAAFTFVEKLFGVKSPSELIEVATAHSRMQFETLSAQGKELAGLAQKVATETAEPIKSGVSKAMKKVA